MFDNYNPDFDIESNNFDLFMQEDPDLFYRSIDHEFPELNHGKEWFINEFRQKNSWFRTKQKLGTNFVWILQIFKFQITQLHKTEDLRY